jgi:hypothetical protein
MKVPIQTVLARATGASDLLSLVALSPPSPRSNWIPEQEMERRKIVALAP